VHGTDLGLCLVVGFVIKNSNPEVLVHMFNQVFSLSYNIMINLMLKTLTVSQTHKVSVSVKTLIYFQMEQHGIWH
jgi:hypothetical protein